LQREPHRRHPGLRGLCSAAGVPIGSGPRWHRAGICACRRAALDRYVPVPPGPRERRGNLEQSRALEGGMRIAYMCMKHGPFGVDAAAGPMPARAVRR
jgi:3-deoxy-manno-octulosonate cytidylyltransferase (CMP-KDO synthetase)